MRWLPEYGVGIIAFGNRTYTGWGGADDRARSPCWRRPARSSRAMPQPSPAARRAQERRVASRHAVGRRGSPTDRGREPVHGQSTRPRARPRWTRCTREVGACRARGRLRRRRECAARTMDDAVRARRVPRVDHAGADDAAAGAVPRGDSVQTPEPPKRRGYCTG